MGHCASNWTPSLVVLEREVQAVLERLAKEREDAR